MLVRETRGTDIVRATYLCGARGPGYRRDDVNGDTVR